MSGKLKGIGLLFFIISHLTLIGQNEFVIGFSQCTIGDDWRKSMIRDMQNEVSLHPGLQLIVKDANNNNEKQIQDIRDLLKDKIDLLIVSPNESEPLTPIVSEVYQKGIPVIVIDRNIKSNEYTTHIGADNFLIGIEAGKYAAKVLDGKGKILEVWGLKGSSPAIERHRGFVEVLKDFPNIQIIAEISGEWEVDVARKAVKSFIADYQNVDLVFAHNDIMAYGAQQEFALHLEIKKPFILGVDALYGPRGGIQMVTSGVIDATFLYPTGGHQAIETAMKILTNQPYQREITLGTVTVDSTNARVIEVQIDQILALQEKINASKDVLNQQTLRVKQQHQRFLISMGLLVLILSLTLLLFRAFRNKQKVNLELSAKNAKIEKQNTEITRQHEELKRVSQELEDATQAKLRFFTNISHEFRTPLTLIQGPLEDMLKSNDFSVRIKEQFLLMLRNTNRLLRLVNQLLDFRKLENESLKLHVNPVKINVFLADIKSTFDSLADKNEITFSVENEFEGLTVWMDEDKIDKVLFNLLSNAFKFTHNGSISIRTEKGMHFLQNDSFECLTIHVIDSGRGISEDHQKRIFGRFYQIEEGNTGNTGTGLGLAFSKGLMELHKGDLTVKSIKGKGTTFSVHIRLGKEHFSEEEVDAGKEKSTKPTKLISENAMVMESEIPENNEDSNWKSKMGEHSILVVEDNLDVRQYIKNSLQGYAIYEAENGKVALEFLENKDVDLVISDVMMPEMDGFELTRKLKTDIKTCHIPIIILTAKSTIEEKIHGLEEGADSYIAKPFNSRHLEVRVKTLIEKRRMLQQHYREHIDLKSESGAINALDKKFLAKLTRIIELNLRDSNLSVESLSDEMHISRVHLYRKIKSLTGLSASEFQRTVRIKKGASLLLQSGKSISEVAFECGFANPSYFTKSFKEFYKVSPTEYVKHHTDA